MKRFSEKREHIFQTAPAARRQPALSTHLEDEWVDLYELLQVPPETSARDLDEAIISRGADVVYFTFSRAGKPPDIKKLEKYLHDMRPILLDAPTRKRYDAERKLHHEKSPAAMRYDEFKNTLDLREYSGGCLSTLLFSSRRHLRGGCWKNWSFPNWSDEFLQNFDYTARNFRGEIF